MEEQTMISQKVDTLSNKIDTLATVVDKVLIAVVDLQERQKNVEGHLTLIEAKVNEIYVKIDGFLVLINRHESEIASLHHAMSRLEDRIARLEGQPA